MLDFHMMNVQMGPVHSTCQGGLLTLVELGQSRRLTQTDSPYEKSNTLVALLSLSLLHASLKELHAIYN